MVQETPCERQGRALKRHRSESDALTQSSRRPDLFSVTQGYGNLTPVKRLGGDLMNTSDSENERTFTYQDLASPSVGLIGLLGLGSCGDLTSFDPLVDGGLDGGQNSGRRAEVAMGAGSDGRTERSLSPLSLLPSPSRQIRRMQRPAKRKPASALSFDCET